LNDLASSAPLLFGIRMKKDLGGAKKKVAPLAKLRGDPPKRGVVRGFAILAPLMGHTNQSRDRKPENDVT